MACRFTISRSGVPTSGTAWNGVVVALREFCFYLVAPLLLFLRMEVRPTQTICLAFLSPFGPAAAASGRTSRGTRRFPEIHPLPHFAEFFARGRRGARPARLDASSIQDSLSPSWPSLRPPVLLSPVRRDRGLSRQLPFVPGAFC